MSELIKLADLKSLGCKVPGTIIGLAIGATVEVVHNGKAIEDLTGGLSAQDLRLRIRLGGFATGLTMEIPMHEEWGVRFVSPRNIREVFGDIPEWGVEIKTENQVGVVRPDWGALIAYKS